MFVPLSDLATVSLGFKSLQNTFYYVNKATIDTFGIEKRFMTPILMLKALDARKHLQSPKPELWLFNCREEKQDLRGTGALKYIEAMADRSAAEKKQSGKSQTIREALEAQSGGLWYAPKARPNKHHIWLRKAVDGVFAPFIFDTPTLVDQRCNSVAAILTSTLFAYSVEINGSASMGAGALEAPTTKLRGYPVLDIRLLSAEDRKSLVSLGAAVWKNGPPVDWSDKAAQPNSALRELDAWLLKKSKRNVSVNTLYGDLRSVCLSRISVAKDKDKKTKKRKADSIGSVAESIAKAVAPKLESRNFPEDFADGADCDISFNFDRKNLKRIAIDQLLDRYEIVVTTKAGDTAYKGDFVQPVAEALIRSLLWGRSTFSISSHRAAMLNAVTSFIAWLSAIDAEIDRLIADSALGTGYEDALRTEVYARLKVHPMAGAKQLPSEIVL
jgi:hypothetical protein